MEGKVRYGNSGEHCNNCPIGFYSASINQNKCTPCGTGNLTEASGSTGSTDCSKFSLVLIITNYILYPCAKTGPQETDWTHLKCVRFCPICISSTSTSSKFVPYICRIYLQSKWFRLQDFICVWRGIFKYGQQQWIPAIRCCWVFCGGSWINYNCKLIVTYSLRILHLSIDIKNH